MANNNRNAWRKDWKIDGFLSQLTGKRCHELPQNPFFVPKNATFVPKNIFLSLFRNGDNMIASKPHAHPTFAPKKQRHNEKQDLHFWRFDHARRGF